MHKHLALLLLAALTYVQPAYADFDLPWDSAFESVPQNSDNFSEGPLRIRDGKDNVRGRLETEHHFGSTNTDDNGLHQVGSARCFVSNTAPTAIADADFNYGGSGVNNLNVSGSNASGSPKDLLGWGRCWLDRDGPDGINGNGDDNSLYIYDQDPNDDATYSDTNWVLVGHAGMWTARNLISCGGFDCMDTTASTEPTQGRWTDATTTGTLSYVATQTTEGLGLALRVSNTTANESVSYELDGLKLSTTYLATARARLVSGSGSCALKTTNMLAGSGINMLETTTASATFATIAGYFTTGTSLASAPQINLEVNVSAGTVVCEYDSVAVQRVTTPAAGEAQLNRTPESGNIVRVLNFNTNTVVTDQRAGTHWSQADIMTLPVTVPDDGYYIKVTASVCLGGKINGSGNDWVAGARLNEDATEVRRGLNGHTEPGTGVEGSVPQNIVLEYINTAPVAGTTYTYNVEVTLETDGAATTTYFVNPVATDMNVASWPLSGLDCTNATYLHVEAIKAN